MAEEFSLGVDEQVDPVVTAKDRHLIRTLWCTVNETAVVECVLDGGSQIVAISESCCNRLRISVDPTAGIPLISANGAIDKTIGLTRNVPVHVPGDITVHLQMYVVRTTAYEVLLGRPFETLVKLKVENPSEEEQLVTMHCPNTGAIARVATTPRGEKKASKMATPAVFRA